MHPTVHDGGEHDQAEAAAGLGQQADKIGRRPWLLVAGWAASLACVAAFAVTAWSHFGEIPWEMFVSARAALAMSAATALYVVAMVVGGGAWYALMHRPNDERRWSVAITVVLIAQFAKYLPGNVAQLAGRVALARYYGFDGARSIAAIAIESALALLAAALIATITLSSDDWILSGGPTRFVPSPALVAILIGLLTAGVVLGATRSRVRQFCIRALDWWRRSAPSRGALAVSFGLVVLAQVLVALGLYVVAGQIFSAGTGRFGWVAGSMALAWMVGFLTPGAPGGLGVREAVLVAMLTRVSNPAVAVAIAVSFRGVTTLGDIAGLLVGLAGTKWLGRPESARRQP
jgi:hypothetical protein